MACEKFFIRLQKEQPIQYGFRNNTAQRTFDWRKDRFVVSNINAGDTEARNTQAVNFNDRESYCEVTINQLQQRHTEIENQLEFDPNVPADRIIE